MVIVYILGIHSERQYKAPATSTPRTRIPTAHRLLLLVTGFALIASRAARISAADQQKIRTKSDR